MEPDEEEKISWETVAREMLLNLEGLIEDGERILRRAKSLVDQLRQEGG